MYVLKLLQEEGRYGEREREREREREEGEMGKKSS